MHQHSLPVQIMFFDVENFTDFIRIWFEIDIFLQKQYVIDFMFAPYAVTNIFVVDSGQIVKIFWAHLQRDGNFVIRIRFDTDNAFHLHVHIHICSGASCTIFT